MGFLYHPTGKRRGVERPQKPIKKITDEEWEEEKVEPEVKETSAEPKKQILIPVDEFFNEETGEVEPVPFPESEWKDKEVVHNKKEVPPMSEDKEKKNVEYTTLRDEFDKAFEDALKYKRKQRIPKVTAYMSRYFDNRDSLLKFIEENVKRRYNAYKQRMVRFERKIYLNDFNYFCTFTYDNKKQTEESFKKRLLKTLQHLSTRYGWKYIAVWERGEKTNRLHLHALVYVPDGKMMGEVTKERDYDTRKHEMQTYRPNSYFTERFGRNDFEEITIIYEKDAAYHYIKKYMTKSQERVIYSRGLPDTFRCDIDGEEVFGFYGPYNEQFIMFDNFHIYRDGQNLGTFEEFKKHYLYKKIKVPRLAG